MPSPAAVDEVATSMARLLAAPGRELAERHFCLKPFSGPECETPWSEGVTRSSVRTTSSFAAMAGVGWSCPANGASLRRIPEHAVCERTTSPSACRPSSTRSSNDRPRTTPASDCPMDTEQRLPTVQDRPRPQRGVQHRTRLLADPRLLLQPQHRPIHRLQVGEDQRFSRQQARLLVQARLTSVRERGGSGSDFGCDNVERRLRGAQPSVRGQHRTDVVEVVEAHPV